MKKWIMILIILIMVIQIVNATTIERYTGTMKWNISKIGLESNIYIDPTNYNVTHTVFVIRADDTYKQQPFASNVPITTLSDSFELNKQSLDLTKDTTLFVKHNQHNVKFKIGYDSITVDGTTENDATYPISANNICSSENKTLYVAYEGSDDDVYFGLSYDNGTTWETKEIYDVEVRTESIGIICLQNRSLFIHFTETTEDRVNGSFSYDNGTTWDGSFEIIYDTGISNGGEASCAANESNHIHCCAISYYGDELWYANSTAWGRNNQIEIHSNNADDTDVCDIEVDGSCVWILGAGTDQDDLDIWGNCANGWGDSNRIGIYGGQGFSYFGISMDIQNEKIYASYGENANVYLCNTTTSNYNSWSCGEIYSSSNVYNPEIAANDKGIYVIYSSLSSATGELYLANSSNGVDWDNHTSLGISSGGYPNIADSQFADFNRMDTTNLHFVFTDGDQSSVNFSSYILSTPSEVSTCDTGWEDGIFNCAENCVVDVEFAIDTLYLYGTGNFYAYSNITVDNLIKSDDCNLITDLTDGNYVTVKIG